MQTVRAFIVEDNPVILDNLTATLEEVAGVRVVGSAADEQTALRWLREHPSAMDIVIVDIFLKSGTGLEVLRQLRDSGLQAHRVVLTNYATAEIDKRCRALGASRVFDKSSQLEELIAYCARVRDGNTTEPGALR
jgi:DNA-binding NarL/FixJ family response regulator